MLRHALTYRRQDDTHAVTLQPTLRRVGGGGKGRGGGGQEGSEGQALLPGEGLGLYERTPHHRPWKSLEILGTDTERVVRQVFKFLFLAENAYFFMLF